MSWLMSLLLNGLALFIADYFVDGFQIHGIIAVVLAVIILGFVNAVIRPIIVFLTFPITLVTLGLFYFVINGITFYLASWLVPGFQVSNFGGAFWGAIVTGLLNWILNGLFNRKD
ncbi:phage holin family protein [Desulfolucanica intricata]|uniref:phage holin family protein n=1 Tax=Desulfolucanica intricata TaxID=1285191 RepID=UPI00082E2205|nr:phage holin family protein [Desulfolucanica intricata]